MQRRCSMVFGVLLFLLLFSSSFSIVVFAAPGEGDGGGGGPAVTLQMDWSYPANGERNVSVTPIIQCKYSHNVAQYNVIKRNATLFSMAKLDGTHVDTNVYAADSQLEFDKRQYIYIEPVKPLEYNTTYIVTVKEGIQAKNSMATGRDQSFQFTTCGRRTDFNETNVSPMTQEQENTTESIDKQSELPTTNADGTQAINPQDSVLSQTPQGSSAGESALTLGAIFLKKMNPVVVTCLAAGFLLILSVIISVIRTKRQK